MKNAFLIASFLTTNLISTLASESKRACEDYRFEPDCTPCFCQGLPCDKKTGACPTDCQPGWHGMSCNISCEPGKFGTNCSGECRCLNSSSCDKRTGACGDGNCLFGWKGKYCNISAIVSEGKSVKMSTQFSNWNAERAVDGNKRTAASPCKCCASTKYTNSPWFQIDLGKLFRIAYIIIYGRTDYKKKLQSFKGLNIYATKHDRSIGEPIFSFSEIKYFLNITLKTPVITQYITLKQTGRKRMVICELQLLEGECADGQFGIGCNETCGHCINGTTCDKVHGNCLSCNPGYHGQLCTASCSNGTYGLNCSSYCDNCQDNECDHVTGQCVHGCNPGYSGLICNTSCGYGSYGINCSQRCGSCANNQTCNNTNGHCDTGCLEGFIEPLCLTRNEELVQDENSSQMLGSAVGIPMGLAFVVLAVVIVTIVILRKRRQKRIPGKDDDVIEADNTKVKNKDDLPSIPNKDPELVQRTVTFANVALEEIEYYDFAPRKEDIKIHQIWDYVHDGMADNCKQFYKEFEGFKKGLQCECKCAKESQNKLKNRYQEVYAYDENRVCLKPSDPSEGDYINASFIDGYEKLEKFIASQGPTKEMIDDFWRMIWQQRCTDIVMLTNIFELGVQKCLQYWPRNDESISFGNIAVKLLKEEKSSDFVIRNLEINHKGDETRIVKQYHFTSWPDKTTPDTAWSLVNFWRIVREGTIDAKYPIVVHCSAGIGRTGTFIALDNLYNQAVTEGSIRPAQMVETLRRQRTYMVQTKEQYVYLHEAVSEALLFGTHFVKTDQFEHMYYYLLEKQMESEKTNLEIQFDLIESSLNDSEPMVNSTPSESNAADDIGKNIPAESEAVYTNVSETLSIKPNNQTNEGTKLHKLYLINNQGKQKLLVKTVPTDSNMTEVFLNLILSSNVTTVLQLQEGAPGLITDMNVGHFDVKISNQTKLENWTRKELSIMNTEQSDIEVARNIQQYEYFDWKNVENTPRNVLSLLCLLSDIHSKQHQNCDGETILLADSGSSRCGVVCVIQNELARMSKEGNVNIIDSVKNIRHLDRDSVSTLEQYRFCYEAILSTIQQNDIYQNVFL
ncbi:receptor-type tyrosine-protein phosphatase epsilon-like isoform X4 [Mercenaria mercenaria]|uniref:receptor-type tyrosine-protein phosphatase epsilon-like isoform X4 n=1 Tax=Mercenaria mercenaria TaxID=6596 RepID=UPI00234E9682|nr:receptor-type tyrosine-protein phosphatase epsilon-like isoform X4 [Mercenaria mercenaria]